VHQSGFGGLCSFSASSRLRTVNAFSVVCVASASSSARPTTSTGDSSFWPISLAVSRAVSPDKRSPTGSIVDDRERAHRRARAAFELQGRAEELELALAEEFLEIDQPFPVRNAEIATQAVLGEDVVGGLVG
jgi:hypothetical protein